MYNLARDSAVFEHPVHSYIFDTSDSVWGTYFTPKELKEAKNYDSKLVMNIPEELQTLLSSFENEEYTTASHYYDHALEYKFRLGTYPDEQWLQESVQEKRTILIYMIKLRKVIETNKNCTLSAYY